MLICVNGDQTAEFAPVVNDGFYTWPCGCRFRMLDGKRLPAGHLPFEYDLENVPLDCPATWELIGSGKDKGVFQLESPLGRHWGKRLKPANIEELSALVSLLRPGCLNAKDDRGISMTELYCLRKHGEEPYEPDVPAISSVLGTTYGIMVYQEQLMHLSQTLAGFDLVEVDTLRKAVGKKDVNLLMEVGRHFVNKAEEKGVVTREKAEAVFENMKKSGRYAFNKCISADTKIYRPTRDKHSKEWAPLTVEEMYLIRNDIDFAKKTGHEQLRRKWMRIGCYGKGLSLCPDGRVRPNIIEDIQPAGVRRLLKIELENGESIRVTPNHKFPTPDGVRTADKLKVGQSLYLKGEYEKCTKSYSFSDVRLADLRVRGKGSVNGAFGEDNCCYTNGSYTEFMKNKLLLPDSCGDCGGTHRRLETHHINGDRGNSSLANLVNLCPSCHKKREYAVGRVKRGEKGYPALTAKIVSISSDGEGMTYDVTMAGPNHNFVVGSGIITCNSHAVSYAVNCFWSAHWKTHVPMYFFQSYLYWSHEKKGKGKKGQGGPLLERKGLINDARHFGVDVRTPDFPAVRERFYNDGRSVIFGLADVKGVGMAAVRNIKRDLPGAEAALGKPLREWSWFEFLTRFSDRCGKTPVCTLAEVGAFAAVAPGVDRKRLLAEYDAWSRLSPGEQAAVLTIGQPLIKKRPVTMEEVADVVRYVYDSDEMKEYRALLKEHKKDPSAPKPIKPSSKGSTTTRKKKKVRVRDDQGNCLYEPVLGDDGKPVVVDPARPVDNLVDALRGILARPKAVSAKRRENVEGALQLLEEPPSPLRDTSYWVAHREANALGISITSSAADSINDPVINCTVREFAQGKDNGGGPLVLGVEVLEADEREVKSGQNKGRPWGRLVVGDPTGVLEGVLVFADVWEQYGDLCRRDGSLVGLVGKKHWKEGDDSFVVEKVLDL